MLRRTDYLVELKSLLDQSPIVAILGPRQVRGRLTLAHMLATLP